MSERWSASSAASPPPSPTRSGRTTTSRRPMSAQRPSTRAWIADTFTFLSGWAGTSPRPSSPASRWSTAARWAARKPPPGPGRRTLVELAPAHGLNIKGMTFSLIGCGNVGSWTGRILAKMGAKLVAVMDHTSSIRSHDRGLDAEALAAHVAKNSGANYAQLTAARRRRGHLQDQRSTRSSPRPRTDGQGAGGQVDPTPGCSSRRQPRPPRPATASSTNLRHRVIPAILANSGGVTHPCLSGCQNKSCVTWDAERSTRPQRHGQPPGPFAAMRQKYNCDMRTAAFRGSRTSARCTRSRDLPIKWQVVRAIEQSPGLSRVRGGFRR